jgi:YD repeat-containing protein
MAKNSYRRERMRYLKITLLSSLYLLSLASISYAQNQQRYFYDSHGNNIGSSMPAGQNTYYYDGQGNNIGSAMKAGRNTYYYDAQGNNVGSSMPSGLNQQE